MSVDRQSFVCSVDEDHSDGTSGLRDPNLICERDTSPVDEENAPVSLGGVVEASGVVCTQRVGQGAQHSLH